MTADCPNSLRRRRGWAALGSALLCLAALTLSAPVARAMPIDASTAPHGEDGSQPDCDDCRPPLTFHGGPVMGSESEPGEVTITPIYWAPRGYAYPPHYEDVIDRYLTDVAADSGTPTNVYAVNQEYFRDDAGQHSSIVYDLHAGAALEDRNAYPRVAAGSGCVLKRGYTACVTRAQIKDEITRQLDDNDLPGDRAHLYVLLFPPHVETLEGDSLSAGGGFCGIHGSFLQPGAAEETVYTDEPFLPASGCSADQHPNGVAARAADAQLDTLSHEINESITDPTDATAWGDGAADVNEIGDECNSYYGPSLGYTSARDKNHSRYNQVINGHRYYTQASFSNATYADNRDDPKPNGCITRAHVGPGDVTAPGDAAGSPSAARFSSVRLSRAAATAAWSTGLAGVAGAAVGADQTDEPTSTPTHATVQATPDVVPADGAATSTVVVTVLDAGDAAVTGAHVHVGVHPAAQGGGNNSPSLTGGECGSFASTDGVTGDDGTVTFVYTASGDDTVCNLSALNDEGGFTDFGVVYQGTTGGFQPTLTQSRPGPLVPGGSPVEFTVTATNTSPRPLSDIQFDLVLGGDDTTNSGITAAQMHVEFSDDTTGGFVDLPLDGSTVNDGVLEATVVPDPDGVLDQGEQHAITFKVSVDASAPTSSTTGHPLLVETDVDQINPADQEINTLAYAGPDEIAVQAAPGDGPTFTSPAVRATVPVGSPYSTVTTVRSVPTATFSVSTLPPGLHFTDRHDNSAAFSGTPTMAGTYRVTVTAANSGGTTTTQDETIKVTDPTGNPGTGGQDPSDVPVSRDGTPSASTNSPGASTAATASPSLSASGTAPAPEPGSAEPSSGTSTPEPATGPRSAPSSTPPDTPLSLQILPPETTVGARDVATVHGPAGAIVELHAYSRPNTRYRVVRRGVLDATGTVSFVVRPGANTRVYASMVGSPNAVSRSLVLLVHTAISLTARSAGGGECTFTGTVLPRRTGELVTVYRLGSDGTRTRTVNVRTGADGTYRAVRALTGNGTFRFLTTTASTPSNAAGTSVVRLLHIAASGHGPGN